MPHQALQDLLWNTGIQHMHRIGVAECMWCDKNRERHTVSSSGGNRFPIQVLTVLSVTSQILTFSVLPVRQLRRSMGIFSVATIVCSWLRYQASEMRNQPVSLLTGRRSSCRSGCLFGPLFQGRKLHKRIRRRERKIPRVSASASLMRAPVFHSVASSILRRRSGT